MTNKDDKKEYPYYCDECGTLVRHDDVMTPIMPGQFNKVWVHKTCHKVVKNR